MGAPENQVETYLNKRVDALGGITRKWTSPGRVGVPDRIIIFDGQVWFVEVKTERGRLSPMQEREIQRLRDHGANVFVAHGCEGVDGFIEKLQQRNLVL